MSGFMATILPASHCERQLSSLSNSKVHADFWSKAAWGESYGQGYQSGKWYQRWNVQRGINQAGEPISGARLTPSTTSSTDDHLSTAWPTHLSLVCPPEPYHDQSQSKWICDIISCMAYSSQSISEHNSRWILDFGQCSGRCGKEPPGLQST